MENSVQPILRNPTTECRATKIHTRRMQSWEVAKCGERLHKDVLCGNRNERFFPSKNLSFLIFSHFSILLRSILFLYPFSVFSSGFSSLVYSIYFN